MNRIVQSYPAGILTLSPTELQARLKCPPEQVRELLDIWVPRIRSAAVCRVCAVETEVSRNNGLCLGPMATDSRGLTAVLNGCNRAILFAATLGSGVDRLLMQSALRSPAHQYIADAAASALIEALCDRAEEDLCGMRPHTHRFSPGYGDLPLQLQPALLRLLDAQRHIGVALTDSLLMTPTKSVTAIIGLRNPIQKE